MSGELTADTVQNLLKISKMGIEKSDTSLKANVHLSIVLVKNKSINFSNSGTWHVWLLLCAELRAHKWVKPSQDVDEIAIVEWKVPPWVRQWLPEDFIV